MGLYGGFLRCSKCDYVFQLHSGTFIPTARSESVYSRGSDELFPLFSQQGWCQECNTIRLHEHMPDAAEIDAFVEQTIRELGKFESGTWERYGAARAAHARTVIRNRSAWHQWRTTRTRGRCLVCGSMHVTRIEADLLAKCEGRLAFAHPGCGGALLLAMENEGLHLDFAHEDCEEEIVYVAYSCAGFPAANRLAGREAELESKFPGLLADIRSLIARLAASGGRLGGEVALPSIADPGTRPALSKALVAFIQDELNDRPPDPSDKDALPIKFPEIHQSVAVLIRAAIHKLDLSRVTRNARGGSAEQPPLDLTTEVHRNPFHVLAVSVRDDRKRIVEQAEEQGLHVDAATCHKARADLIHPRTRLSAEMAWLPGLSPRRAATLVAMLRSRPMDVRQEAGLPALARANLLAAAFEAIDSEYSGAEVAEFIHEFALAVEGIDPEDVLREVNEDRAVSGFPEVKGIEQVELELAERRRYYRNAIRETLDRLASSELLAAMTLVVRNATLHGETHAPELLDDLVDAYEIETQGVLQQESQKANTLMRTALERASAGEAAVASVVDKLEAVARTWDRIAQPIQLSAKARGLEHEASKQIAYAIRGLAVDLCNEHDMIEQSKRLTGLLAELFSELPEFAERVSGDAKALNEISEKRAKAERERREWEEQIAFSAEVGMVFKDVLAISARGVSWKSKNYPLDSITRVRWGGVRHSVNGMPTGTDYTVAFGDDRSEAVVSLKREWEFLKFTEKLWRAVGVRLMTDILRTLKSGSTVHVGEAAVHDDGITLVKRRFLGPNEPVRCSWAQVRMWSADGSVGIGSRNDEKTYVSLSYIEVPNAHLLEQLIRAAFQRPGLRCLSELLG